MRAATISLTAIALALSTARASHAQPRDAQKEERWAKTQGTRVGLDVDVLRTSEDPPTPTGLGSDVVCVSIGLVTQVRIFAGLHLDAEFPMAYGTRTIAVTGTDGEESRADRSGFFFANPTLGVHYAHTIIPSIALFGGLDASIPLNSTPDADDASTAALMAAARASFDVRRTLYNHVPLRTRVGTEIRLAGFVLIRSDVALTLGIPVVDGAEANGTFETGNELELRAPFGFGAGARLQLAIASSDDDAAQLAFEPFVGYEPSKSGMFTRAGLLIAMDRPLGFGFDPGKVRTIHATVGSKF